MTISPPDAGGTKDGFSALDTRALALELRGLGKCWFDKAYELPGERLLVTFKVQGRGRWELRVVPGKFATLGPSEKERPDDPGRLGAELRRTLSGAPLLGVAQPSGERYLELAFGRGGEESPALLALELFGSGNVVAVRQGRVTAVLHARVWAGRRLRPGEPYRPPPARDDPFERSEGDLLALLQRSKNDRVTTLAARLGLGSSLAQEVLSRAGLEPHAPSLEEAERAAPRIRDALRALSQEVAEPPRGFLYRRTDAGGASVPVDATPFPGHRWRGRDGVVEEVRERFSEVAESYFLERVPPPPPPSSAEEQARTARREELERLRAQQVTAIEGLQRAVAEDRGRADLLLSHFDDATRQVEESRRTDPESPRAKVLLEGQEVEVSSVRSLRESAQELYEAAKSRSLKLQGAKRALRESEAALAQVAREAAEAARRSARNTPPPPGATAPPSGGDLGAERPWRVPRRKHFWFEKAPRWFLSSEGLVVVGGRDARSNDALVKRYLKERDVYVHADLQGAPSIVVKRPAPGQGEIGAATLREACQWGATYSKAWRAGLAAADAFWVAGDQVSKAGASGEFVAKGSWVIHGTRHYERDLPLTVDLGVVVHEGELLVQAGPPAAFARPGSRVLWRVLPGDERDRERLEREISQDLGLARDRVQALLPPGGLSARRP